MQNLSATKILAFCLISAFGLISDLPARGESSGHASKNGDESSVVALSPADAGNKLTNNKDYKLTVSDIQKLYKQSTDGLSSSKHITQNPAHIMYSRGPVIPLSALQLPASTQDMLSTGVPTQGLPLTDTAFKAQLLQIQQQLLSQISDPVRNIPRELAQQLATQTMLGNTAAQVATTQANYAINYAGKYLINFTANEGNVWNRLRNNIFVPIAILLLLPGAILTQTKAMMSQSNPVIETSNPFEGILRAVIAMCFIPASYLVVNYGIDFSNSISHTIQEAYRGLFGSDMYIDAFLAEQRAFPSRQAAENQNALSGLPLIAPPVVADGSYVNGFGQLENDLIKNKNFSSDGTQEATTGLVDEVLPANSVAARMAIFGTNALVTSVWDLLCAFQLVYLHYLFLVGPIMAAIWVYPIKQLREAWPNWIAGTVTLCFWSLFWNTAILLMALFKDVDSTGTFIMTALNLLATGSVKYAFDFVGLVTEAGQEAAKIARTGKNEQGGDLSSQPSPATNKIFSENTKETGHGSGGGLLGGVLGGGGGGGLLGGITKFAASAALNAAAPGAGQALSLGSQLLGGLGGSKGGSSSGILGDLTKGLSLPPLVSTVAQSAFPGSAAAFGIVGATGMLGKDGISLPPLSGGDESGGGLGVLGALTGSGASNFEADVLSLGEKSSGGSGLGALLGGMEKTFEEVSGGAGGSGGTNAIGGLFAAASMAGLAGMAISAASSGSGADQTSCGQGGGSADPLGAIGATAAGSIFAAATHGSSRDVSNFMNTLALGANGAGHGLGIHSAGSHVLDFAGHDAPSAFIAASMPGINLPPSARASASGGGLSDHGNRSGMHTSSNHLGNHLSNSHKHETSANKESNYTTNSASNSYDLSRDISCKDAEMGDRIQLNFAAAPPLAFGAAASYSGPPPLSSAFAKLAGDQTEFATGGLDDFDKASTAEIGGSVFNYSEMSASNFFRASTESATTFDAIGDEKGESGSYDAENDQFFAAATASCPERLYKMAVEAKANAHNATEACESTISLPSVAAGETQLRTELTALVRPNQNPQLRSTDNALISPNYDAYMRPATPDQNERLSGDPALADLQPIQQTRRPRSLQELMKQTAFERPCDTCKNTSCHCVITTPPVVSAWS